MRRMKDGSSPSVAIEPPTTRSRLYALAAVAAVVVLLAGATATAAAVPSVSTPAILKKQAEATQARAHLADLADEREERLEAYNEVTAELADTRARIAVTTQELRAATANLDRSEQLLGSRADRIYRKGSVEILEVLLGVRSFDDLLTRLELLRLIGESDARLVAEVKLQRNRVDRAKTALEQREREQVALRAEADVRLKGVQEAHERQRTFLASLQAEVAQLVRDEEARQKRLAEERARKAREEAARRAAEAADRDNGPFDPDKLPLGRAEVVDVALRYLGVPYVWGGSSPSGFDCSGLVQYAYRQVGVELPRTSRSQFRTGTRIPPGRVDLLRAGDLVFFGTNGDPSRVHHVGIFVGGGDFLHAPASGDVVRISSLTERINERGDYVGASRP